jgi:hypothetical protein
MAPGLILLKCGCFLTYRRAMTDEATRPLTPAEAQAKADECRKLARAALDESHRIMLISIAETWERIAADTRWKQ